jgi:hypothetical protein
MQNRYVGDVGDFAKYALLRALVHQDEFCLGIVWCAFENETHNSDGRHVSYLEQPEFADLDPILHSKLTRIVTSGDRSIEAIQRAGLFSRYAISFQHAICPSRAVVASRLNRERHRSSWLARALSATKTCDLVFFDPDNGFEVSSVPKNHSKAGKYIFFDELNLFWRRGQSLVVYHHLNRTASVSEQTKILRKRIVERFRDASLVRSVLFRRGSCRHFWIIGQSKHASRLSGRVQGMLSSGWDGLFEID